jgi:hypothetical protein
LLGTGLQNSLVSPERYPYKHGCGFLDIDEGS